MSKKAVIMARFVDGYALRQLFGTLKSEDDVATIMFLHNEIEISAMSRTKCVVYSVAINCDDIDLYHCDYTDESGSAMNIVAFNFETTQMFNATKGLTKKDGLSIEMNKGDSRLAVKKIIGDNKTSGRAAATFVDVKLAEPLKFVAGDYKETPNIKIKAKEFSAFCSSSVAAKCSYVDFNSLVYGVILQGLSSDNKTAIYDTFIDKNVATPDNIDAVHARVENYSSTDNQLIDSNLEIVDPDQIVCVRVPISNIKSLSKIHNISQAGTFLKFHFEPNSPIKIVSPLSNFGSCTIFINCNK